MNRPSQWTGAGFGERAQEPIADIPTDTEEFLLWGTKLDPDHPFKYELSNGKVSRTMIEVSRAHWLVTATSWPSYCRSGIARGFMQARQSSEFGLGWASAIRT